MTKREQREAIRLMKAAYLKKVMQRVVPKRFDVQVEYSDFHNGWCVSMLSKTRCLGWCFEKYPGSIPGAAEKIARLMVSKHGKMARRKK
jgi:hypothetical protein